MSIAYHDVPYRLLFLNLKLSSAKLSHVANDVSLRGEEELGPLLLFDPL
jgi:hypothetical protein